MTLAASAGTGCAPGGVVAVAVWCQLRIRASRPEWRWLFAVSLQTSKNIAIAEQKGLNHNCFAIMAADFCCHDGCCQDAQQRWTHMKLSKAQLLLQEVYPAHSAPDLGRKAAAAMYLRHREEKTKRQTLPAFKMLHNGQTLNYFTLRQGSRGAHL